MPESDQESKPMPLWKGIARAFAMALGGTAVFVTGLFLIAEYRAYLLGGFIAIIGFIMLSNYRAVNPPLEADDDD